MLSAINALFDHQAFQNAQSSQPSVDANDWHHMPTSMGKRLLEQQMHVHQHKGTTTDQAPQLDVKLDGQWAMRTHFSWKEGFLTAHKPPTHWLTLMSMQ